MHIHHIKDMAKSVSRNLKLDGDQRKKVKKVLERYWEDKMAVVWTAGDVMGIAKDNNRRISRDDAIEVLGDALNSHDACVGITWEVLRQKLPE